MSMKRAKLVSESSTLSSLKGHFQSIWSFFTMFEMLPASSISSCWSYRRRTLVVWVLASLAQYALTLKASPLLVKPYISSFTSVWGRSSSSCVVPDMLFWLFCVMSAIRCTFSSVASPPILITFDGPSQGSGSYYPPAFLSSRSSCTCLPIHLTMTAKVSFSLWRPSNRSTCFCNFSNYSMTSSLFGFWITLMSLIPSYSYSFRVFYMHSAAKSGNGKLYGSVLANMMPMLSLTKLVRLWL